MLVTPKERNTPPKAFKRERNGTFISLSISIDSMTSNRLTTNRQNDILSLKRENHKLQRDIEKLKFLHKAEVDKLNCDFEDKIAQICMEKEKENALILDAKTVEHEDQLLDTENRLHRDYIDKISKYQEIIKDLKEENQSLYEENSLKQRQLDEFSELILLLKNENKTLKSNLDHITISNNHPNQSRCSSQTFKREPSTTSIQTNPCENKENNVSISNPPESTKKHPIDNLQGYYNKIKEKRTSRTRNSNYLNSVHSINPGKPYPMTL